MSTYSYDIQKAIKLVEGYCADNKFDRIYPFTTENISGYIDYFDLKDKSLLTVGSSSDQAINAIYRDVKEVTVIDRNPFIKYYFFLKLAALNTLSRSDFFDFFKYYDHPKVFKHNENVFNKEVFNKIKVELRKLDYLSYLFWNELFSSYSSKDIKTHLFDAEEERTDVLTYLNLYLKDDDSYKKTREKLYNKIPEFVNDNIMYSTHNKTYDYIWLSNIALYYGEYEDYLHMTSEMFKRLNEGGLLQMTYLYGVRENYIPDKDDHNIYHIKDMLKLLKDYNPKVLSFIGVYGIKGIISGYYDKLYSCDYDSIIVCKKLKK